MWKIIGMDKLVIFPKMQRQFGILGENIKLARLRRKLTTQQVAERADISLECLAQVEGGDWNISIGIYANVLRVLNLEQDIFRIADNDILGRKLQDIELLGRDSLP